MMTGLGAAWCDAWDEEGVSLLEQAGRLWRGLAGEVTSDQLRAEAAADWFHLAESRVHRSRYDEAALA